MNPVDVIAEVLRKHGELPDSAGVCDCGWWKSDESIEDHVARLVNEALGGLTRAWAAVLPDDSYFGPHHEAHEFSPGRARQKAVADSEEYDDAELSFRWVGGWISEANS